MKIATGGQTGSVRRQDVDAELDRIIRELEGPPSLIVAFHGATVETDLVDALSQAIDPSLTIGTTSCLGSMTEVDTFGNGEDSFTLWAVRDPDGAYGTALGEIGNSPAQAARQTLHAALEAAGRPGEQPDMIWMHASPGCEEAVLQEINALTGGSVPITGGSAADDDISGNWTCFAGGKASSQAVALAVMFPSTKLTWSFQSGYEPTSFRGIVTAADERTIMEIDDRPAALVYDEWTGGLIGDVLEGQDQNVLGLSTMSPLGREVGTIGPAGLQIPYYALLHPESVGDDLSLALFADVTEGETVHLMSGSMERLIDRGGRVAADAVRDIGAEPAVAGGLVIYCAGCMLAVGDRIDDVRLKINTGFGGAPWAGAFTFGEQGRMLGGENLHGNLMIAALAFGQTK